MHTFSREDEGNDNLFVQFGSKNLKALPLMSDRKLYLVVLPQDTAPDHPGGEGEEGENR